MVYNDNESQIQNIVKKFEEIDFVFILKEMNR